MTAGMSAFESPFALAEEIRTTVSRELGLTVSIGVSFNKVFAKLASDMKKPDAVTMVTRENYRTLVWRQPVEALLFVGHATAEKLHRFSIHTIGDLAAADTAFLRTLLGKSGVMNSNCTRSRMNSGARPLISFTRTSGKYFSPSFGGRMAPFTVSPGFSPKSLICDGET